MSYHRYGPNGEKLRYRDPIVMSPYDRDEDHEQEQNSGGESFPLDLYGNFVNAYPTDPNLRVNTSYNDAFVRNAPITPSTQQAPSINIVQHTPDVIANPQLRPAASLNPGSEFFNDEDYYYHNTSGNPSGSSRGSNKSMDELADQSERPILNQGRKDNMSFVFNDDPMTMNVHRLSSEDGTDLEDGYIDQRGDDYQLNTFLGKNGEMVDPYNQRLSSSQQPYGFEPGEELADEGDLSSSGGEHKDLGDYDEPKTLDRATKFQTLSTVSTNATRDGEEADGMPKRSATVVRKFKLWKGNFVFDSPISQSLLKQYSSVSGEKVSNEFKFMRYQAITCEPDEIADNNFTVRQLNYIVPRETELMIVITMYNEDHYLLGRTLKGVMDNIKHMVRKKRSSTWGPDAWKKIVVCVVSDGRAKVSEKALALLSALGCYQDGFAKDEINGKKVRMHVYEHTTMMNITHVSEKGLELESNSNTVPVQLLFALKEQNQQKINSHRWAFEGFAELLQPNVVTLLDAGTMTSKKAIYHLWREFRNPQVGGACGEIKADLGKGCRKLFNPLVASQNFEYKMSNILDKTTESNFGFITVLPGAFSAYRFEAVKGVPLQKYFYGEKVDEQKFNFFSSNMYLAEDRILCFELVTKKNSNWILKYCRSSSASTDVPERVPEFILQRRRWLNGSFFASVYSFVHFYRIWTSGHNIFRKLLLSIEFVYLFLNTVLSWFSLSSFFLVFRILTMSIALSYGSAFNVLCVVFYWLYGVCIVSTFILSLGNKPKTTEWFYVATCVFFAVLMVYMLFCSIFMSVKSFEDILGQKVTFVGLVTEQAFRDLVISLGSTVCLYALSSIIYLQPWHMITSFAQYVLLTPSYVNVLNIYAFCNVHDLSWGTKGSAAKPLGKILAKEDGTFNMEIPVSGQEIQSDYDKYLLILSRGSEEDEGSKEIPPEERKASYYAKVRSVVIIVWLLTNFGVCAAVLEYGGIGDYLAMKSSNVTGDADDTAKGHERPIITDKATIYFTIILWIVALSAAIRFIGCSLYMLRRLIKRLTFC
ncbi:related to Chitin synthase 1 [Zygosaccharomyces bailii]|nr:related to Chitin synthase 1 [Zygosaccharomyces bailii]